MLIDQFTKYENKQLEQLGGLIHEISQLSLLSIFPIFLMNQVIFITLAIMKVKKWSKPLRVKGKGIKGRGQGSHFSTLEKTLTLGQG